MNTIFSLFQTICFQGARWDINTGFIAESKLKELHPTMPIIYIKAVSQEINVNILIAILIFYLYLDYRINKNLRPFMSVQFTKPDKEVILLYFS